MAADAAAHNAGRAVRIACEQSFANEPCPLALARFAEIVRANYPTFTAAVMLHV